MRGVDGFGVLSLYMLTTDEMGFVINKPCQYLLATLLGVSLLVFVRFSLSPGKQLH